MRVVVFAKQVPALGSPGRIDAQTIAWAGKARFALDAAGLHAVEAALGAVEAAESPEVVLVSMGPRPVTAGLRTGLAMGAARGIIVSDDVIAGCDALETAKVLAAAVRRLGAELVVAGSEPTDGSMAFVPAQAAELLGWPAVTEARSLAVAAGSARAERHTTSGRQDVECRLPCVVSMTGAVGDPRYLPLRKIVEARDKPVEVLSAADLGLGNKVGRSGARQQVVDVSARPRRQVAGAVFADDGHGDERIVGFLAGLGLL